MGLARNVLLLLAVVTSWGCGSADVADLPLQSEDVGGTQQAALAPCMPGDACKDYKTADGRVWSRIYSSWYQGPGPNIEVTASIDTNEFVLVGGGAEIWGSEEPGALLSGSFPAYSGVVAGKKLWGGWTAKAKDHVYPYNLSLRSYAIGLRLEGYTTAQLRQAVSVVEAWSSSGSGRVGVEATIPLGGQPAWAFLTLGGGARAWHASNTTAGRYLVDSYPRGVNQWLAIGKDHMLYESGQTVSWQFYIPRSPPGLGYELDSDTKSVWSSTGGGYRTATVTTSADAVPVGVYAQQENSGQGRLLTDVYPLTGSQKGATATSKDHQVADSGRVRAGIQLLRALP